MTGGEVKKKKLNITLIVGDRVHWIGLNPKRIFHGCARYRECSKCKYFKWVDAKFLGQVIKVILELLEG